MSSQNVINVPSVVNNSKYVTKHVRKEPIVFKIIQIYTGSFNVIHKRPIKL